LLASLQQTIAFAYVKSRKSFQSSDSVKLRELIIALIEKRDQSHVSAFMRNGVNLPSARFAFCSDRTASKYGDDQAVCQPKARTPSSASLHN